MLAGEAQARGVYLEGYGVFFDVQVPMLRQSMMWSLRTMLDQDDAATQAAISDLRKHVQGITDPATRAVARNARSNGWNAGRRSRRCRAPRQRGGRDPGVMPGSMVPPRAAARSARQQ